ncbi:MAG: DUF4160 domain-containing protein [Bacteroidales bacterium]|nr:DUF4160 domain-containing protein [Bacteroidales bacterium]
MGKKEVVKITEAQLREIVKESVKKVLDESAALALNYYDKAEPLVEMARINMKESGKGSFFPFNAWEVKIWSDDHEPPHFHIKRNGWNVSFAIETGEQIEISSQGTEKNVYDYMITNVSKWLDSPCAILPQITNRQNAMAQWLQLHG